MTIQHLRSVFKIDNGASKSVKQTRQKKQVTISHLDAAHKNIKTSSKGFNYEMSNQGDDEDNDFEK